jgi:tRNA (guanine-N7-)-methyltransferase
MARRKRIKKAAYQDFPNCFDKSSSLPGRWHEFFGRKQALFLELGCGHGEFVLEMARRYPERNCLGVDLKMDRMWRSAGAALSSGTKNIGFLCLHLLELAEHFAPGEADEIWITFPDPFPKKRQAKHRMVNRHFMDQYERILKPGGKVHFKTDNLELFHFGLEVLVQKGNIRLDHLTFDLHNDETVHPDARILTTYERRFLDMGMKINYVAFRFVAEG